MDFGEILEPTSRAFWDELDELAEEIEETSSIELNWIQPNGEKLMQNSKKLIILEGSNLIRILNNNLLKDAKLCCQPTKGSVSIYSKVVDNSIICISEENNLSLSGILTELLNPWINIVENLITVSIQPKVIFKGHDLKEIEENTTLIRGINSKLPYIKELEPPNFITGLCAGAAHLRYTKQLPLSCYIIYNESTNLDQLSIHPLIQLLKDLDVHYDFSQPIKPKSSSNLYM